MVKNSSTDGTEILHWSERIISDGTNLRALGLNPRALGTNERAVAKNKWALRNWKRQQRKKRNG